MSSFAPRKNVLHIENKPRKHRSETGRYIVSQAEFVICFSRSEWRQRHCGAVDGDQSTESPADGGIGALAASGRPMVSTAELLASEVRAPQRQSAKSCIFIYQYGGLSQLDSWDPKPDAPVEIRGSYRPIPTRTPGFQVGELMPRLADLSDRYSVIRSMSHQVPVHNIANEMLLAGRSDPNRDSPSLGSVITRLRPVDAAIPAHVWLQKFGGGAAPADRAYLTGGFLGMSHAPLLLGERHDDNPATEGFQVRAFETAQDVDRERLNKRWDLLRRLETSPPPNAQVMDDFQQRAIELLSTREAQKAFDLEQEPAAMRDRYGRNPFGQNLLMARRLIEAGVRLVNVVAWMGLAPNDKFMSIETWDMHGNAGIGIFENGWNGLGWALPAVILPSRLCWKISPIADCWIPLWWYSSENSDGHQKSAEVLPPLVGITGPTVTRQCWPAPECKAESSMAHRMKPLPM